MATTNNIFPNSSGSGFMDGSIPTNPTGTNQMQASTNISPMNWDFGSYNGAAGYANPMPIPQQYQNMQQQGQQLPAGWSWNFMQNLMSPLYSPQYQQAGYGMPQPLQGGMQQPFIGPPHPEIIMNQAQGAYNNTDSGPNGSILPPPYQQAPEIPTTIPRSDETNVGLGTGTGQQPFVPPTIPRADETTTGTGTPTPSFLGGPTLQSGGTPASNTGGMSATGTGQFGNWNTGIPGSQNMFGLDVGSLLGGTPTSQLSGQINDIWGSGIGQAVTNFLTQGAGYNPAVVSALTNAFRPFQEEGLANIREAFGRSGASDSSASALGQERFLRDMYLGDQSILAGQYNNSVDRYSGMLSNLLQGAQANEANKLGPLDWINALLPLLSGVKGLFNSNAATGNTVTVNVGGQPVTIPKPTGGGGTVPTPPKPPVNIPSTPPTFPPTQFPPGTVTPPSVGGGPNTGSDTSIIFNPSDPYPPGGVGNPDPFGGPTTTYIPGLGDFPNVPTPPPIEAPWQIPTGDDGGFLAPGANDLGVDNWFNDFLNDPYGSFGLDGGASGMGSGGGSASGGGGGSGSGLDDWGNWFTEFADGK